MRESLTRDGSHASVSFSVKALPRAPVLLLVQAPFVLLLAKVAVRKHLNLNVIVPSGTVVVKQDLRGAATERQDAEL